MGDFDITLSQDRERLSELSDEAHFLSYLPATPFTYIVLNTCDLSCFFFSSRSLSVRTGMASQGFQNAENITHSSAERIKQLNGIDKVCLIRPHQYYI